MGSASIASSSVASVTSINTSADGSAAMAAVTNGSESIKEEEIDYKTSGDVKPPYSYASLICMAMRTNQHKMTLSSIYKWIKENFLYYRNADPSWQVTTKTTKSSSDLFRDRVRCGLWFDRIGELLNSQLCSYLL
jgi:hypothetical protein